MKIINFLEMLSVRSILLLHQPYITIIIILRANSFLCRKNLRYLSKMISIASCRQQRKENVMDRAAIRMNTYQLNPSHGKVCSILKPLSVLAARTKWNALKIVVVIQNNVTTDRCQRIRLFVLTRMLKRK